MPSFRQNRTEIISCNFIYETEKKRHKTKKSRSHVAEDFCEKNTNIYLFGVSK